MANPVKLRATVRCIEDYGDGVYIVSLLPEKRVPRYKPGQFLHLTLDPYDPQGGFWPESRVFSIASGSQDQELVLAYSVKGRYTQRISSKLKSGKRVWLKLPYGDFIVGQERNVCLVAGGTGITPFISFLSDELRAPSNRSIRLVYGVQRCGLILFKELLHRCCSLPNFNLIVFSEAGEGSINGLDQIQPYNGRITVAKLLNGLVDSEETVFFLSGPLGMIDHLRDELTKLGVKSERIRVDQWE